MPSFWLQSITMCPWASVSPVHSAGMGSGQCTWAAWSQHSGVDSMAPSPTSDSSHGQKRETSPASKDPVLGRSGADSGGAGVWGALPEEGDAVQRERGGPSLGVRHFPSPLHGGSLRVSCDAWSSNPALPLPHCGTLDPCLSLSVCSCKTGTRVPTSQSC